MTKVVFFGNERLVSGLDKTETPVLRGLIDNGYDVVAVVSHHTNGQSRNQRVLEVASIAKAHNIPLFLPGSPSEIAQELRDMNAEVAVLSAYGRIISQQVIDIFPMGILNIHPSLLPKYRGPTPIESVILNGDETTGVSIMSLTAGMDEGPIYVQAKLSVDKAEDKFSLYSKLSDIGAELLFDTLTSVIDGSLEPKPQEQSNASYCHLIQKSDGNIDWRKPAVQIEREIRAYKRWPQSRAKIGTLDVIIASAHVIQGSKKPGDIVLNDANELSVGTGDGLLSIDSVKPLGKKEMPVSAFLAGYRHQLDT